MSQPKSPIKKFLTHGYVLLGWLILVPTVIGTLLFIAIVTTAYLSPEGPLNTDGNGAQSKPTAVIEGSVTSANEATADNQNDQ